MASLLVCSYEVVVRDFNAYGNITETRASSKVNALHETFKTHYGIASGAVCVLTGDCSDSQLKLAHIVPRSTRCDIRNCLHLSKDDLNSFRNLIFLCNGVEAAFDRLRVSFVPKSPLDQTLVLKIWDETVKTEKIHIRSDSLIGDFEGASLNLMMENGCEHNPFRRCFAYQALVSYLQHNSTSDTSDAPDVARNPDSLASFSAKRAELLEWHSRFRQTRNVEIREDGVD